MILRSLIGIALIIVDRHADLAGERGAVGLDESLHVVLGLFCHHHAIHQDAGDLHLTRIERAALGDPLHLHDDDAARVARRHCDRQRLKRQRLLLHRDVAVDVRGGAAHDADVDVERLVEQVLLAVDRHQRHQIVGGARVDLSAAQAWIDEGAQPDLGQVAGLVGGDVAKQVRDHALRQVVGLDPVGDRERLQLGHQPPVAADHALDQSFVTKVIQAAFLAVALPAA
jgi:hypothetical protein